MSVSNPNGQEYRSQNHVIASGTAGIAKIRDTGKAFDRCRFALRVQRHWHSQRLFLEQFNDREHTRLGHVVQSTGAKEMALCTQTKSTIRATPILPLLGTPTLERCLLSS
jgi:hypothetical protein